MYQSLYRKYRPTTFSELYGQDVAKKILTNSLKSEKISHAYLFFGPRGTGKTSVAKMFARICNCDKSKTGECCEICEDCKSSKEKNCVDIVEIDAASNNGVDEIRELKSKINLIPSSLKYKVYIIDEVHMLSTGAFNALLKTLEEPPKHVIFILATTEYYKVPATIISRCQTIEFSKIDNNNMKNRIKEIAEKENIEIDNSGIEEIVRNSDGGLRDAIGLVDKAIAFAGDGQKITSKTIKELLGNVSTEEIEQIIDLIQNKDTQALFSCITKYCNQGIDLMKVIDDLIIKYRDNMIAQKSYELIDIIDVLNEFQIKMKESNHKDIIFQSLIIKLTTNQTNVRKTNDMNETKDNEKDKITNKIVPEKKDYDRTLVNIRINNSFVDADKKILTLVKEKWNSLNDFTFDPSIGSLVCDLLDCLPIVSSKNNLMLCCNYSSMANKINQDIDVYQKIISEKLSLTQKLVVIDKEEWEKLKKNYLNNLKNNIKYQYVAECSENDKSNINTQENTNLPTTTKDKAIELFGKID